MYTFLHIVNNSNLWEVVCNQKYHNILSAFRNTGFHSQQLHRYNPLPALPPKYHIIQASTVSAFIFCMLFDIFYRQRSYTFKVTSVCITHVLANKKYPNNSTATRFLCPVCEFIFNSLLISYTCSCFPWIPQSERLAFCYLQRKKS